MQNGKTKKDQIRRMIAVVLAVLALIGCSMPAVSAAEGDGDMYSEYTYFGG